MSISAANVEPPLERAAFNAFLATTVLLPITKTVDLPLLSTRLTDGKRDPEPLFAALQSMIAHGVFRRGE